MGPAVSIIIPTHNRAKILHQCLLRLFGQTIPPADWEVVVADDASDDETGAVVRGFARSNLLYVRLETNRGAGAARNRAIELARGDLLVFLDDDAFVRPDFLAQHLAAHHAVRDAIVTGPIVEVSEIPPADVGPSGWFEGWHGNPFPTGNASVARSAVIAAGGFDESFGIYGWEDAELHRRLARLSLRARYVRQAPIFHYKPASVRQNFVQRIRREQNRGAMGAMFYAKHPQFAVGWQTKQHGFFYGLDRVVDSALGLTGLTARALDTGAAPHSAFLRLLVINHVEIDSGRQEWNRLGAKGREDMAVATLAMVKARHE